MIKVCEYCNNEFEVFKSSKVIYCSWACLTEKRKELRFDFVCGWCGKTQNVLRSNNIGRKYCSKKCAGESLKKDRHNCVTCGKETVRKYCSKECYRIKDSKNTVYITCFKCNEQFLVKEPIDNYVCNRCQQNKSEIKECICATCGIKFNRSKNYIRSDRVFCDKKCKDNYRQEESTRECLYCGNKFTAMSNKKNYCSGLCNSRKNRGIKLENIGNWKANKCVCDNCGIEFKRSLSLIGKHVFCNPKCKDEFYSKINFDHTCSACGNKFTTKSSVSKFCSRNCVEEYRKRNTIKEFTCEGCGSTFTNNSKKKFCSEKCVLRHSSECKSGKNNPSYVETKSKPCLYCGEPIEHKNAKHVKSFCSYGCFGKHNAKYTDADIINAIKEVANKLLRTPTTKEVKERTGIDSITACSRFGTWRAAIEAAGLKPITTFGVTQFAKDGHKCNSESERIIDDFMVANGIEHEREPLYPGTKYRADWLVNGNYVEFFGMVSCNGSIGENYKNRMEEKFQLATTLNIPIVPLYSTTDTELMVLASLV